MYEEMFQLPSYDYSHEELNEADELHYTHSDGDLRVVAKLLMLEQQSKNLTPRMRAANERELGHVVFEMAYRSGNIPEYIGMTAVEAA